MSKYLYIALKNLGISIKYTTLIILGSHSYYPPPPTHTHSCMAVRHTLDLSYLHFSPAGAQSSFLEGIQPHLGVTHQSSHLYGSPVYSHAAQHDQPIKSEPSSYANTDFIKEFLPDRSQKNFETILNQNKDWSDEQIDHFLHSAVDLSEIELNLCSTGYESDSGYSTFDVSPIASHPPVTLSHPPLECVPGAHLQQQQHAPGPMFNPTCSFSPATTAFQDPAHSATSSPCSTEAGFFSPHTDLESMATAPNQISQFFGGDLATQGVQMYHQPQAAGGMFGGAYFMEGQNGYLNSRIPDILVQSAEHQRKGSNFLSCRRNSDSQVTQGESSNSMLRGQLATRSLPNMGQIAHLVKPEYNEVNGHLTEVKEERRHSCSVSAASSNLSNGRATTMKASKKSKSNPKPANQRRKNQWPRSMNKANMMAFRQHILNKLKKGQESAADSCAVKQEATSPKAMKDQEFAEQISETDSYEVQVKLQRNHSSDNRSQSEPVDGSDSPTLLVLHQSQSEGDVNKNNTTLSSCDTDTSHLTELFSDDIFNSFSFNPDSLLSRAEEEQMLKTLGFDESDDEIATFLGVGCGSLMAAGSVSNQVMDLDCIQELLDNTEVSSPLSLPPLVETSLESSVFESPSPLNSNPISQGSQLLVSSASNSLSIDFYTSTAPQYTMEGNLVNTTTVYQPTLFGDFGNCAPEVFDI